MNFIKLVKIAVLFTAILVLGACQITMTNPAATIPATAEAPAATTPATSETMTETATITDSASITTGISVTNTDEIPGMGDIASATAVSTTEPVTSAVTAEQTTPVTVTAPVTTTTGTTDTVSDTMTDTVTDTMTNTVGAGATDETLFIDIPALDVDMSDMTIGEIISNGEGFSTLATAVQRANVLALLNSEGPITLFAPTDNAFLNYPDGTVEELLNNPTLLVDLLQYHLIVDNANIAQLAELGSAPTYVGEPLTIGVDADGAFYVNDVVIVQSDIQASNGVIHVINGLLVPTTAQNLISSRTVNPDAETDTSARDMTLEQLAAADTSALTVLEVIRSIEGFSTLSAAIDVAGLNDALSTGGPITLLAPTNGAFNEIPALEVEALLNGEPSQLIALLQYHTILDGVTSADLAELGIALTATGDPVTVTVNTDGIIMLNDGTATVYMADIEAANGVVHAISALLTPPEQ